MQRLVLIDGHAILHRAYHALPPLTNSKGKQINAVFGFISMILRVINDLKPTHLAVTFDRAKPTFRKKIFTGYQAKRPKMDEELVPQIAAVHKVLERMGVQIFEKDGYEADDVIGTIAQKTRNQLDVIIVTGDRDLLQLVDEKVKLYMPVKGLSESKLYGELEVEEKFGIRPSQMVDYKALVGDQSDNYPGIAGIGPKTASSLLSHFQTLEHMYEHLDGVENETLKKKLAKDKDAAELAKQLATIVTDVPVDFNLEKCRLINFDRPDIHALFEELEFRSLILRLGNKTMKQLNNEEMRQKNMKAEKSKKKDQQEQLTLI